MGSNLWDVPWDAWDMVGRDTVSRHLPWYAVICPTACSYF